MNEKTQHFDLYACPTMLCVVSTFYRVDTCPVCQNPGVLIRYPVTGRGLPSDRPLVS